MRKGDQDMANNEDKKKALEAAIAKLEKDFGRGTVMRLGDPKAQVAVETVPTGALSLDIALGLGGVPKGRIVEIYGPESSGKTTVALHMIAEVQKRGGIAGLLMRNMHWIRFMRAILVWISMSFIFLSLTAETRHWRSQRRWYAPERWTSS